MTQTFLVLHNIRSVLNVGALFRTAECAGIAKVYLVGYTPTPLDRFGNKRNDFTKAALGAEELVPWEHVSDINELLFQYKKEDVRCIALEQSSNSVDYKTLKQETDTAILVGNEVEGLSKDILNAVDTIAEIPLRGKKESLNVSSAAAIFLFRFLNI